MNIEGAIRNAQVIWDGDFIDIPNRGSVDVRVPAAGVERKVSQVPDQELELAITNLVRENGAVEQIELMTAVARIYGWNRRGPEITSRLTAVIRRMLAGGRLAGDESAVSLNEPPS